MTSLVGAYLMVQDPFASPIDAVFGACVGAGAITIIGWLGEVALKKEAMGFGDTTLMAMVGAALGPSRALLTIFAGAFIAAAVFLVVAYPVWNAACEARAASKVRSAALQCRSESFSRPLRSFTLLLRPEHHRLVSQLDLSVHNE